MQEVDGLTIDLGRELRKLIQSGLVLAPVVASAPVLGQVLEVVERNASAPAEAGQLVGPARVGYALVQVVQVGLGNGNGEWLDTHVIFLLVLVSCSFSAYKYSVTLKEDTINPRFNPLVACIDCSSERRHVLHRSSCK